MISVINSWNGAVEINSTLYKSISDIPSDLVLDDSMIIVLKSNIERSANQIAEASDKVYKVTVRQYMTKKGTQDFDFMTKWNNDIPMPLRTMVGTIEKETPGMYKMNLHADISFNQLQTCMKCGKVITNTVSQFFGMGPECGGHNYVNPFDSEEELKKAIEDYKINILSKITWSGWVIKSSITEMEEIKDGN